MTQQGTKEGFGTTPNVGKDEADAKGKHPDNDASNALEPGSKEKIDQKLDELNVSTTESGKEQVSKPDTEGSTSSSKNLDEQGE